MSDKTLTKADILRSVDDIESIYFEDLGGVIELKPLTDGQYSQIQSIKASGGKLKGSPVYTKSGDVDREESSKNMEMEIDIAKSAQMDFEADATAVAYAMSVKDTWTVDDVMRMKPTGIVLKIAKEVYRISGATPKRLKQVNSFRDVERGAINSDASSNGSAVGGDAK